MQPGSTHGVGTVSKTRSEMDPNEVIAILDEKIALVVEQKDRLFDRLQEAKARIKELEAENDILQGRLDLLQRPESTESPFLEGVSIEGPPHIFDGAPKWSCGAWTWMDAEEGAHPAGYSWMRREDCPAHRP